EANYNLKNLDQTKFEAIEYSCNQLIRGNFHDQFPIDMMQGGAGTSTNMNANDVLANVALEYMGHSKGQYQYLHPNNDINMSQSTNDVYPTAIRLGLLLSLDELNLPFNNLILSFLNKSQEFAHILKMGRTQLQDAVPMTLGQEFGAFAVTLQKDLEQINTLIPNVLAYMNLGGTAIGT
ncbi:lyase family protein, partial [Acinetobacter nosocomialis]|uniref:lyase family protein n=1 Tax=Acinetobacter nosocomialis TaxID=106654 RepID=UPI00208DFC31